MAVCRLPQPRPPPTGSSTRIDRVPDLVEATGGGEVGGVGHVLTFDVEWAAPFTVVVAVESEVETQPEMEPGVAHGLDADRTTGAILHDEVEPSAEHAAVGGVEAELGTQPGDAFDATVGMLDGAFGPTLLIAEGEELPVLVMDGVARTVLALEEHRAPRETEVDTRPQPTVLEVVEREPDVLADAPRMIAGREPPFGGDLRARAVHLDPAGGHADLVVTEHVDVPAIAPPRILLVALLQHRGDDRLERPLEGNRCCLVGLTAEADLPERLHDLVVQRTHALPIGVVAQPATGPDDPLLLALGDAAVPVEDIAVDVLADAEADLERAVSGGGHGTDLLGPGPVRLGDPGVGLGDLVGEPFVGRHQRPYQPRRALPGCLVGRSRTLRHGKPRPRRHHAPPLTSTVCRRHRLTTGRTVTSSAMSETRSRGPSRRRPVDRGLTAGGAHHFSLRRGEWSTSPARAPAGPTRRWW